MTIFDKVEADLAASSSASSSCNAPTDSYTIFVGPKSSGKSTLVQQFLGKQDGTKPTVALEYQFARRLKPGRGVVGWGEGGGFLPVYGGFVGAKAWCVQSILRVIFDMS